MPLERRFLATTLLVVLACLAPGPAGAQEAPSVDAFDAAWARRADGASGGTAGAAAVEAVLAAGRKALTASPSSLPARWRMLRALYFQGEHATVGETAKRTVFEEGKKLGEETLDLIRKEAGAAAGKDLSKATPVELVPYVKGRADVVPCFLWASVDWGKWALVFGKSAAARQGAAAKIRDYATAVVQLDPAFDDAGGYRVLGRLHHQTPSIPFITGWASRTEALKYLRLAVEKAPRNFVNRLYLAEAIWDYEKEKRPEARKMLQGLAAEAPSADMPVEDARAQEDAKALLSAWGKG